MRHIELIQQIEKEIRDLSGSFESYQLGPAQTRSEEIAALIRRRVAGEDSDLQKRVLEEFEGMGPLSSLMADGSITEIMINGSKNVWIEREGVLSAVDDHFASDLSYRNFCHRLLDRSHVLISSEQPTGHGHIGPFRLHVIGAELTKTETHFCLRRHPENPWTFDRLAEVQWGTAEQREALKKLVRSGLNFVVIGGTGSGKTSVLNACLQSLRASERCVIIEDTLELKIPNAASLRLLTREDPNGILKRIDQSDLVKNSLRLRPDRIVMGEIRGEEAKDFLMALSTGHAGSFGSLHAASASQALIRLEMLIQLGAPHWSLTAIRRLIQMSLQAIVVVGRDASGKRYLEGIYRLSSLEENGILLEKTK
jgi:pilus assembly protein CpaF